MLASYNGAGFLIVWLQVFGDTFRTDNREPAPFFLPCLQKEFIMGLFDLFNQKSVASVPAMMDLVYKYAAEYMDNYSIRKDQDAENAVFMFCSWAVWNHCLNNDLLPSKDCHYDYLAEVLYHISLNHSISETEFLLLYQNRFKIYKSEIRVLEVSEYDYPLTKLYICFHKQQYLLVDSDSDTCMENGDWSVLGTFAQKFTDFWKKIKYDLTISF